VNKAAEQFAAAVGLQQAGRNNEAAALCEAILADVPDHPQALHLLGALRFAAGDAAAAVALVRRAVLALPDYPSAHFNLAAMLVSLGDWDGAGTHYGRAATLQPEHPLVAERYAGVLLLLGRYDEAEKAATMALRRAPGSANAQAYLGAVSHARLDFAAATRWYERALAIDPGQDMARDGLDLARQRLAFASNGLQSSHGPARQVFMSAVAGLLRDRPAPLRVLEIGSYMGASAVTWARALDRLAGRPSVLVCVDSWGDIADQAYATVMTGSLKSGLAYATFLSNVAALPPSVTVEPLRGASDAVLATLPAASFDLIYVDGSHLYEDVRRDLRHALRLVRPGGFVCGDDLELQAGDCDRTFAWDRRGVDTATDPRSGSFFHPGVTLAVDEALGRVSVYDGFWVVQQNGSGFRPVDLAGAAALLPLHWPRGIVEQLRERFATSGELTIVA
jgi:tetratricopeptide (TPR) repeat protein